MMEQLLIALQHLRSDLEHLYEDLERIETSLTRREKDDGIRLPDLADHVEDLGGQLHAAFTQVNFLDHWSELGAEG